MGDLTLNTSEYFLSTATRHAYWLGWVLRTGATQSK